MEILTQYILRHGKGMPGVRRGLEPPLLTTMQTQFPANTFNPMNTDDNVDFGKDKRLDTSNADKLPSVTIFTASSRNSLVYRPFGILSIFTPPSWLLT